MKKLLGLLIALCSLVVLVTSCDATNPNYVTGTVNSVLTDNYNFDAENTPMNELRVAEAVKVAGTTFRRTSPFWQPWWTLFTDWYMPFREAQRRSITQLPSGRAWLLV